MKIIKLSIFDLVDSPQLAKMVYFVQQVLPETPIEKLRLSHFPFEVIEPLFVPDEDSLEYLTRFALAIMVTHVETKKDVPAFSLDREEVDQIIFSMIKEATYLMAGAMDMPKGFIPEECKTALSTALVKWDQADPLSNVSNIPGAARFETHQFLNNALKAAKEHLEKKYPGATNSAWDKVFERMNQ